MGELLLDKKIPVASGIGGGSADAAAALRLLCRAWSCSPGDSALQRIALRLGADVPVCLHDRPARMRGVGETLTGGPSLPECGLVLVNPGVPMSTVSVFRALSISAYTPEAVLPDGWGTAHEMAATLSEFTNDLEAAAVSLAPVINEVLHGIARTRGCLLSRMSGSGATCFGLFTDSAEAEAAADELARTGWWTWGGPLGT